jgi:UV DNA damage repair endonuclease
MEGMKAVKRDFINLRILIKIITKLLEHGISLFRLSEKAEKFMDFPAGFYICIIL